MAVQFRDYYETLGVSKTATDDEIRSAFRKLARKHHPDVAKDKKTAEEKFKQINEAYEVLSDPEKRARYDIAHEQQRKDRWRLVATEKLHGADADAKKAHRAALTAAAARLEGSKGFAK